MNSGRERVERRLIAVLIADVAGYSRLMGTDEEGTLAALKAIRRELGDPKIAEHHGRIVKTTGDGVLVEFASVIDAARCAVVVQREMARRNADIPHPKLSPSILKLCARRDRPKGERKRSSRSKAYGSNSDRPSRGRSGVGRGGRNIGLIEVFALEQQRGPMIFCNRVRKTVAEIELRWVPPPPPVSRKCIERSLCVPVGDWDRRRSA